MKKTISINISGILFHIEEDGYTHLKNYLEAINKHFSHYEDNHEIISDIENRIAEIFLSYLKNNKQVITAENVESLIEKMGTIADFKATEEKIDNGFTESGTAEDAEDFYKYITPPNQEAGKGYKKLTRIENRKILGGVCAGIAHYMAIDPLWTRLIAILLLFSGRLNFGTWDFLPFNWGFNFSLAGWSVLAYIVLWIILPSRIITEEDKNIKKLYRNPDDRVIGGVSSGLAAYLNIEVIWVRLAFLALIFAGGSGFVIYLILWIITPMAKSITERIEMKGGAITLTNIENTILQGQNPPPMREESKARRAFMTPFRVVGKGINEVGTAMGPLGLFLLTLFRIFFGAIIFIIGISLIFASMVFLGAYFNLIEGDTFGLQTGNIPLEIITEFVPFYLAVALAMIILVPAMIITVMGVSIWVRRNLIHGRIGLVALFIWLISIAVAGFVLPQTFREFGSETTTNETQYLELPTTGILVIEGRSTPQVTISQRRGRTSETLFHNDIQLTLEGTSDNRLRLEQTFSSKGRNYDDARRNIEAIQYSYEMEDSVLTVDKNIQLTSLGRFRAQELEQTLYIPYNQPFVMDKSILSVLRGTLYRNGYKLKDVHSQNYWVFNENGLLCLTCRSDHKQSEMDRESREMFADAGFMR